jgi:hypothetical protein
MIGHIGLVAIGFPRATDRIGIEGKNGQGPTRWYL